MGATMTTDCGSFRGVSHALDRGITRKASAFIVKCEHFVSMILVRGPVPLGQPVSPASALVFSSGAGGARTHDRGIMSRY